MVGAQKYLNHLSWRPQPQPLPWMRFQSCSKKLHCAVSGNFLWHFPYWTGVKFAGKTSVPRTSRQGCPWPGGGQPQAGRWGGRVGPFHICSPLVSEMVNTSAALCQAWLVGRGGGSLKILHAWCLLVFHGINIIIVGALDRHILFCIGAIDRSFIWTLRCKLHVLV